MPGNYEVQQEVVVDSEISDVFAQVNELRNWEKWAFSNASLDSTLVASFEGPAFGEGAIYSWQSESGDGRMEIVKSLPKKRIEMRAIMQEGAFISDISFDFSPNKDGILVVWKECGEFGWNPLNRFVAYLLDFEGKIAENYKQSLTELKTVCEQSGN
ncbi:SRPBCC family protein [Flammeovirgaceae bacterium SG7u.111]|nr:SRPBCC family protein [Flammeovirgaceae bacterium SG7u.132]WPO33083.1 SRPBCC family protein [Flammeovirgaceae bacterium SG7u.111]